MSWMILVYFYFLILCYYNSIILKFTPLWFNTCVWGKTFPQKYSCFLILHVLKIETESKNCSLSQGDSLSSSAVVVVTGGGGVAVVEHVCFMFKALNSALDTICFTLAFPDVALVAPELCWTGVPFPAGQTKNHLD